MSIAERDLEILEERVVLDDLEAGELAVEYDAAEPEDVLEWAFNRFGRRVALISSFQADGVALIDMAWRLNPDVRIITIDTGRLPQQTFEVIDAVRKKYGIQVEVIFPEAAAVETMVKRHGVNSFFESVPLRLTCCYLRKVMPLNRALLGLDAWVTGLRREQWATRANIRKIEVDHDHGGIIKISPLADWTEAEVWDYIKQMEVPYHPLYDQGFTSISCQPCTRAVPKGTDPRSGRWWWEENAPKECGMHCSIETGGFEHEVAAILGEAHGNSKG
jgi:phosphoadenosine phosphosulfate reductase